MNGVRFDVGGPAFGRRVLDREDGSLRKYFQGMELASIQMEQCLYEFDVMEVLGVLDQTRSASTFGR